MRDPETLPIEEMAHYLLRKRIELCRPSINVQGNGLRPEEEEEERFRGWVKGQYKQLIARIIHEVS